MDNAVYLGQLLIVGMLGVCLIALAIVDDIRGEVGTRTVTRRFP